MLPDGLSENPVVAALLQFNEAAVLGGSRDRGELSLTIAPDAIVPVCQWLKQTQQYNRMSSITALDRYPMTEPRFEIVYLLHSNPRNERLRLKCPLSEGQEIESVYSVWAGADWYEREVFDLFGVVFRNHPNLQRIMMPTDWEGHPLRKDYPVHGFKYSYQDE